jgi:uncharacterized protein YndB with AHSA1/START domain
MIATNNIAKAEATINSPIGEVWDALTNPDMIRKYMFGATVISDWKEGSKIVWKGEWEGRPYEDKGKILLFEPQRKLQYSHYSPVSGLDDKPENYHIVTIDLTKEDDQTHVNLEQNNNPNEEAKEHSEKNWKMMLNSLKKILEGNN